MKLTEEQLTEAYFESSDHFLQLIIDSYLAAIDNTLSAESMNRLTGHQHSLLAYHYLQSEVMQGGFVQLIQNGYGAYIFDNPTAKAMKDYGAIEIGRIIYKAKDIYNSSRKELERDTTEEEFMAMYVDFEQFDELEERYFEIEEEQTHIIATYVYNNLDLFVTF